MAITESIIAELQNSSILTASLHGVRTVLERELNLKNLLIATDDTIINELKRKGHTGYPTSYLSINELIGVKDQNHNRYAQRFGVQMGVSGATKATSAKGHMFAINVGMELKYIDNDPMRLIVMAEALAILSMIGGMVFSMSVNGLEIQVRVEIPENTAIPLASAEATADPDGSEISVNLVVHTYAGFFKDVSAVQSGNPVIDYTLKGG
jgi:hypothetical protein